jgi:hypothetical protein
MKSGKKSRLDLKRSMDAGTARTDVNVMNFGHILARIILRQRRQNK